MTWLARGALWLLGGFNPLRDAIGSLWQAALRNPWRAVAIWFAIIIVVNMLLLRSERADNAQLRADIIEIGKARKQARDNQAAVNHAPAAISQAIAQESRAHEKALYDAGRAAGAAYADANRVRQAPVCPARPADLPGADRPAAQHDGPGADGDMVAISRPDFDTCTSGNLRLAQVRTDAEALIASGVAVPDGSKAGE